MKRNYRKSKEQLDQQNKERIIAEKKHQYRQVLMRIFKRQNNTDISQLNILGITETGPGEGEILFKCKRDSKQETYVIRIQTIENKKMYKITKPAEKGGSKGHDKRSNNKQRGQNKTANIIERIKTAFKLSC